MWSETELPKAVYFRHLHTAEGVKELRDSGQLPVQQQAWRLKLMMEQTIHQSRQEHKQQMRDLLREELSDLRKASAAHEDT